MTKPALRIKDFGPIKILIVDDDLDLSAYFTEAFEMEEYEVVSCKNGREALDTLNELEDFELPDLILLDYNMPVMNGDVFNREKLKVPRLASIPVVLMTANGGMVSLMDEVKAEAYMSKPLDLNVLLNVVYNFVSRPELHHNQNYF